MWAEQLDHTGFLQTTLLFYSGDSLLNYYENGLKLSRSVQMVLGQ